MLNAGDMAVLGWNALNDTITFTTLVNLPAGTVIKLTDKGWDQPNNAFTASETGDGVITWTVSSEISAGSVFDLKLGGSDEPTTLENKTASSILTGDITVSGFSVTDPMNLAGDSVFIYQGTDDNPSFIFGMNNSAGPVDGTNWNTLIDATLRDSMLPNGSGSLNALTNGVNSIGLPGDTSQQDNVQYTGPDSITDKATWLERITNVANWNGDNTGTTSTSVGTSVSIGGPNDAPSFTEFGPFSVVENSGNGTTVGDVDANDGDGGDSDINVTYTIIGGNPDLDNDKTSGFSIDHSSGVITISDPDDIDFGTATSHTLSIRATDDKGATTDQDIKINVTEAFVAPTLSATPNNPTYIEQTKGTSLFGTVTASANDVGQTFTGMTLTITNVSNGSSEQIFFQSNTVALTDSNAVTLLSGNGNATVVVSEGTATVYFTNMSRSDIQMASFVDALTYRNTNNAPDTSDRVITITHITDSGSNTNQSAVNLSSTVTVVAVNDPPSATNRTQTVTYNDDATSVALGDIVVTDPDGVDTITATLTLANTGAGTLTTGTFDSVTSTYNAGTGVWTVTGSISDVNAALAAVAFTPESGWTQDTTITTRIRDAANTGPADGTITLDVSDVTAPIVTSIERQAPGMSVTNADGLTWRVTFSESVSNIDVTDFALTGTTAGISSVQSAGGNAYDVTVSGGDLVALDGTVTLDFDVNQNITDAAGNSMVATTPTGTNDSAYTLDNTGPVLDGTGSVPSDDGLVFDLASNLTLDFSENIKLGGTGWITIRDITKDGGNFTFASFDVTAPEGVITINDDKLILNPATNLAEGSKYAIYVESGAIQDVASNNFAGISDSTTFNFETAPLVELSVDNTTIAEAGGIATFTVQLKDAAGSTRVAKDDVAVTIGLAGSATDMSDYTVGGNINLSTVTISAGQSSQTFTVTAKDDGLGDNNETVSVSIDGVSKGFESGTQQQTVTLVENATPVQLPPPPAGDTTTVDGADVTTSEGTAPDGSAVQVTEIAVVTPNRQEQTGDASLANIPIVSSGNNTLLEVGLPTGVGMRVETPTGGNGLIAAIRARTNTPQQQADQEELTGVGSGFLGDLPDSSNLIVRTLVPTAGSGSTGPAQTITISAPVPQPGSAPVALVIDTRNLPSGTTITLDNVQFAAVIGDIRINGGAGTQIVSGDGGNQIIVLGGDDDILRGGGGDDLIGSREGNDRLYGDAGNDWLVGGVGDDILEGGTGNDILQGGSSDAGAWRYSLQNGELVSHFTATEAIAAETPEFTRAGPWWTQGDTGFESDNRLAFTYVDPQHLKLVAALYKAATGEFAPLMDYNSYITSGMSETQLAEAAVNFFFDSQGTLPQALELQLELLIEAVWGEGSASDELITLGLEHLDGGGSWGEAMLFLARAQEAEQLLRNDNGDLVLMQDHQSSEAGWSPNSGNDILRGGEGNDRLVGGDGNNILDGGEGTDVAVFTGAVQDFLLRLQLGADGRDEILLTRKATGDVNTLIDIELLKIGGHYYGASEALADLDLNTSYELGDLLVQLTAQHVQSLDLPGIY